MNINKLLVHIWTKGQVEKKHLGLLRASAIITNKHGRAAQWGKKFIAFTWNQYGTDVAFTLNIEKSKGYIKIGDEKRDVQYIKSTEADSKSQQLQLAFN